jgi:hypothetical protein
MKRIQTSTAVPDMFGPGKSGFTDGDASVGVPATDLNAAFFNQLQESIVRVQEEVGLAEDDDPGQFLAAIIQLINDRVGGYSILALPTEDIGPITVTEVGEVWTWSTSAYFTGYRSPLCGRPLDGHTVTPLMSEVDAVGGLLSKTAYARLWGYARENALVVTQAVWTANIGAHYFVDVDANNFRVPDLRNMFRRYTGTDADTANARALGSYKADSIKNHSHASGSAIQQSSGSTGGATRGYGTDAGYQGGATGTAETAPKHVAYAPRIHA